jgi:hypothetical protein
MAEHTALDTRTDRPHAEVFETRRPERSRSLAARSVDCTPEQRIAHRRQS